MKHISAGLVIIYNQHILLVQQNLGRSGRHLSIPKGLINPNENPMDAAIRETLEETGIAIAVDQISSGPFLMNIETDSFQRRIIYYVVHLEKEQNVCPIDDQEIAWAGFVTYAEAEKRLQKSQLSVLLHLNSNKIPTKALQWLSFNGYLTIEEHHEAQLKIYNYTSKCKTDSLWDEITLWCRGLITDKDNNILYRPLKKFFEESQMFNNFIPNKKQDFLLFEKKDGALGILYWLNDIPFIATRGSFNTLQAINGTRILYTKHFDDIIKMNRSYTYFFEIISPKDKHIVDYGDIEDLFLIGAFDNINKKDILSIDIHGLSFPKVKHFSSNIDWDELKSIDRKNEEGLVAYFEDGTRIKVKFANYKKKHAEIYG